MDEIMRRFDQLLWEKSISATNSAKALYQSLEPAGDFGLWCWKDIDYTDQQRSFWAAAKHYERIQLVLKGFGKQHLLEDQVYAAKMIGALNYWLVNDFENPNWWHNQIGMPQNIGNIAIMMHPVLDQDTLTRAADLVAKGSMAKNKEIVGRWTGANLIWGALNTVRHALLTGDEPLLYFAAEQISKEITMGTPEGIQEDRSFFQHGARLYSGGYGRSFLYDVSKILFLLNGTRFQLPAEKTELVVSFVLDGLRLMVQGNALDWACVGREFTRVDAVRVGIIETALKTLIQTPNLPRKQELQAFLASVQGGEQPDITKYFDQAFMLCHHFNGLYVGAKFLSNHLLGAEICNGEGQLCYNMSYGTHTCIMRNGGEYDNIAPLWDYSRVPGTTSRLETDEQLLMHENWKKMPLSNTHSGGKQRGRRAVIYELAEHDDIKMLVADFAFEDGFVCLGTQMESTGCDADELVTTVDQCLIQGDVVTENNSVIHNAIRYMALQDTHMEAAVETKCGSWRRNNVALSDEPVSAEVLTLTISYSAGKQCAYAYMISAAHTPIPKIKVLRNDCHVQAIGLPDGSVLAVFHQPSVLLVDGREITGEAGTILC